MSGSPKLTDFVLVGLAALFSSKPVLVLTALTVIIGPAALLMFVPIAGPILMLIGLAGVAVGLGMMSGLCIKDAVRLQHLRMENLPLSSCITRKSVVMAWAASAISASAGAALLFFIISMIQFLSAS